jgi:hypothetical protein
VCEGNGNALSCVCFNLWIALTTKIFVLNELEEKMEAKGQDMIKMKDEMDFFSLIERKLEQQGFEVLETLPPDQNSRDNSKTILTYRSTSRFAF